MAFTLPSHPSVASRVTTVLVRSIVLASLALSMAILTTNTTTLQVGGNFLVEVKFMDVYSYRYLLGTIVIGAAYMLLQIANTIYRICKSNQSDNDNGDGGLLFDFFGDKMVSYFLATGMAAAFGATKDLKATFEGSGSNVDKFFDKGYAAASLILFSLARHYSPSSPRSPSQKTCESDDHRNLYYPIDQCYDCLSRVL